MNFTNNTVLPFIFSLLQYFQFSHQCVHIWSSMKNLLPHKCCFLIFVAFNFTFLWSLMRKSTTRNIETQVSQVINSQKIVRKHTWGSMMLRWVTWSEAAQCSWLLTTSTDNTAAGTLLVWNQQSLAMITSIIFQQCSIPWQIIYVLLLIRMYRSTVILFRIFKCFKSKYLHYSGFSSFKAFLSTYLFSESTV